MYWVEGKTSYAEYFILSADINGDNEKTLYRGDTLFWFIWGPQGLYISKHFICWRESTHILRIPKKQSYDSDVHPKNMTVPEFHSTASNYEIEENTQGIPLCKALKSMLPNYSATDTTDESLTHVNETKVSGDSRNSGERCDVPVCYNYCFQGECSASTDGPQCRWNMFI